MSVSLFYSLNLTLNEAWSESHYYIFKGLFKRAILQSGAWTSPQWRMLSMEEALEVGQYGVDKLNCTGETRADTLQCMQVS